MQDKLVKEIERLKELLNSMAAEDNSSGEILKVSQLLDVLIVQYYREQYLAR